MWVSLEIITGQIICFFWPSQILNHISNLTTQLETMFYVEIYIKATNQFYIHV
jgi:hypothetical protein